MLDNSKEPISALMDGELSEFELHRVLKESAGDPQVSEKFRRYQLQRSALQDADNRYLGLDISQQVAAAVADESGPTVSEWPRWLKPAASLALAASVAAVVVFSGPLLNRTNGEATPQLAELGAATSPALSAARQNLVPVTDGAGRNTNHEAQRAIEQALLQQRVNTYMQIHARHASMNGSQGAMPLARVASYRVQ